MTKSNDTHVRVTYLLRAIGGLESPTVDYPLPDTMKARYTKITEVLDSEGKTISVTRDQVLSTYTLTGTEHVSTLTNAEVKQ